MSLMKKEFNGKKVDHTFFSNNRIYKLQEIKYFTSCFDRELELDINI